MTSLPSFAANGPFKLSEKEFIPRALDIFRFQYAQNPLYRDFVRSFGAGPGSVGRIEDIPFLPVGFFKTHSVRTGEFTPEIVFESSGTSGQVPSRHLVKDLDIYRKSFQAGFSAFYGPAENWCVIGLLPAYLERSHSSLVFMVDDLIRLSAHPDSGFYLYDHERLLAVLQRLEASGQKTLLIGVSFALLDFTEHHRLDLHHTVVMETGGMKGRRREVTREELHAVLRERLGLRSVHAEYGMTELLSQAYSTGDGVFRCPPWMRIMIRDEDDPLEVAGAGNGLVNVIDLANIWSCAFLATDDIGRLSEDGGFEILGRADTSDFRGCNLMVGS